MGRSIRSIIKPLNGLSKDGCWILSTVRSGSWYLCRLLNETGLFRPTFGEGMSHRGWLDFGLPRGVSRYTKIIRRHYLFHFTDSDREEIEKSYPGMKYLYLTRTDNFARAVSLYFSLHHAGWQYDRKPNAVIPWNDDKMLAVYAEVSDPRYNRWDEFVQGADYMPIDFDALCEDPVEILRKIRRFLGIERVPCRKVAKRVEVKVTFRPESEEYIARLKELVESNPELPEPITQQEWKLLGYGGVI